MNKNIIQYHLKKNLFSLRFLAIIAISVLIFYINVYTTNDWNQLENRNFINYVITFDGIGVGTDVYLFFIPFLSSLLGGALWGSEVRARRNLFVLSRCKKKIYQNSLLFTSFLLGGIAGVFPVVLNLMVAWINFPHFDKIPKHSEYPVFQTDFWGDALFNRMPAVTIILLVLLIFVFSGFFSLLSLSLSFIYPKVVIEMLAPFIASFIIYLVTFSIGLSSYSLNSFLNFSYTSNRGVWGMLVYLVLFVFIIGGLVIKLDRSDTLD